MALQESLGRGALRLFPTLEKPHSEMTFGTAHLGVPKPCCFKPGCLQLLRRSALMHFFAPLFALFCGLAFLLLPTDRDWELHCTVRVTLGLQANALNRQTINK